MLKRLTNQQKLTALAVASSLILCAEIVAVNFAKFNIILSGGGNYNYDFPDSGFGQAKLIINIVYIIINIVYLIWLLQPPKENTSKFLLILKKSGIFLIIAFISYPFSSDIYMYLQYGLMGLNKINPYLHAANSFTSILSPFVVWPLPATYGPISLLLFMSAASTVAVSPLLGVYVFKVFCVIAHIINAYLIWRLLNTNRHRTKITSAYLLNPLILTQHVSDAHVDVFVCTSLIILIGCLYYRYFVAAILAIWLGVFTKTLPIIWLPLVVTFLVRQRRWKALVIGAFLSFLVIIILSFTVLPTIEAWKSLVNTGVTGLVARSLHHLLYIFLKYSPVKQTEQLVRSFTSFTYLIFAIYYSWTLLKVLWKRSYAEANLISDIGWTTLVLFLFATPWLMSWYPTVLLPVAALSINSRLFVLTSLTLCVSSSIIVGTGSGSSAISIITVISTVGPPIVILLYGRKFLNNIINRMTLLNNSAA